MITMRWTSSISPLLFLATYCNGTWSSHVNTTGRGRLIASNSNDSANAKWKCAKSCRKRGKTLKRKRAVKSSSGTQSTHANPVFLPAKESDKRPATTVGIQSAHTQRSSTSTASTAFSGRGARTCAKVVAPSRSGPSRSQSLRQAVTFSTGGSTWPSCQHSTEQNNRLVGTGKCSSASPSTTPPRRSHSACSPPSRKDDTHRATRTQNQRKVARADPRRAENQRTPIQRP